MPKENLHLDHGTFYAKIHTQLHFQQNAWSSRKFRGGSDKQNLLVHKIYYDKLLGKICESDTNDSHRLRLTFR